MSYEDIEEARAKRTAKEVIKGKGKHGRKRKNTALDAGEPEPEEVRAAKDRRKRGRKCKSAALEAGEPKPEPEVARMIGAPEPWRAPVARMI